MPWRFVFTKIFPLQIILNMEQFCNKINVNDTITEDLKNIKETFTTIQVGSCVFGVIGNILNIQTLQSPSLRTVPFMYILSLAYFDLIALTLILCHFILVRFPSITPIMFYTTYIEAPIINTFLIAGLYCAFFCTLERNFMTNVHARALPYKAHKNRTRRKIFLMLSLSFIIHLPMVLQRTLQLEENGQYIMVNNVDLLCKEPNWSLYSYYKLARECLRFLIVILMTVFNVVLSVQLHNYKNFRQRVRRPSPLTDVSNGIAADSESTVNSLITSKKEESQLIRSFAERKLTVLMIVICIIFLLGNIPQIIVMILQNESMENNYKFQLYRHCSNTLEVLNHCLNFYVFCIASSDYTRAFLHNYRCLRKFLYRFPKIARFLSSRRSSSVMVSSSVGLGMANKEYLSMDSIPKENDKWVVDPSSSPNPQADSNIKGILVTGNRETRQKKSLTIVNHRATEIEADSDHEVTSI